MSLTAELHEPKPSQPELRSAASVVPPNLARLSGELQRYLIVAVVALLVDLAALLVLRELAGTSTFVAAALAFVLGLLTNYFLSVAWVFPARNVQSPLLEFVLFATIGIVGLALTELLLFCGTDLLGIDYRLVKLLAVGVVFVWNFGVRKLLLFRTTSVEPLGHTSQPATSASNS